MSEQSWTAEFRALRERVDSQTREGQATDLEIAWILDDHPNQISRWTTGVTKPRGEDKRTKILERLRAVIKTQHARRA